VSGRAQPWILSRLFLHKTACFPDVRSNDPCLLKAVTAGYSLIFYFFLNLKKKSTVLRIKPLPREVVESPSLEIFKTPLNKVLCSLL